LRKQLEADIITFVEYAYNLTVAIIHAPDERMETCIRSIPVSRIAEYAAYLQGSLESSDFMPCPSPFLVGPVTEAEIEQSKQRLRPKYIRLYQVVLNQSPSGQHRS
jgi:hypothetical protein